MNYRRWALFTGFIGFVYFILPNLHKINNIFSPNKKKMLTGGWKKKEHSDELSIKVVEKLNECIKEKPDLKYDEIIHIETQVVAGLNARVLVKLNNEHYYHTFHIPLEKHSAIQYVNSVKTSL